MNALKVGDTIKKGKEEYRVTSVDGVNIKALSTSPRKIKINPVKVV